MILNAQKKSTVAANVAEILKSNENKHTFMPGWCKLAKSSGRSVLSESAIDVCQVCNAKDKKEKDAKLAEDNRRATVASDKYKADKIASENARKAKLLEDAKNAKLRVLTVELSMNKNNDIKVVTPENKSGEDKLKKSYFYSYGGIGKNGGYNRDCIYSLLDMLAYSDVSQNYFIYNNNPLFTKNEFFRCFALPTGGSSYNKFVDKFNFPPNIGIVILNRMKPILNKNYFISDLVNEKGTRIFNDDDVTAIIHFADDYFILFKGGFYDRGNSYGITGWNFDDATIYNIKTKIAHPIQKYKTGVQVSNGTNITQGALYGVSGEILSKETYKAFFVTEIGHKEFIVYYITNEGIIKEQKIKY